MACHFCDDLSLTVKRDSFEECYMYLVSVQQKPVLMAEHRLDGESAVMFGIDAYYCPMCGRKLKGDT